MGLGFIAGSGDSADTGLGDNPGQGQLPQGDFVLIGDGTQRFKRFLNP